MMKGAWLNSRDGESSYNSYNLPQYHHNGRTIASKTLTESFLGVQNSSGPMNFTLPYVEDYMVLECRKNMSISIIDFIVRVWS